MAKQPIKVGDVVHCIFLDHAENSKDSMKFEVFGKVIEITKTAYNIVAWGYVDSTDKAADGNPDNEKWFSIVKKAITDIKVLK